MRAARFAVSILMLLTACGVDVQPDTVAGPTDLSSEQSLSAEDESATVHDVLRASQERWERQFAGAFGEPIEQFAAKCDLATGIHVPNFVCSAGTVVPTTNFLNGKCDRPNRLNQVCDPGSSFQIVAQNNDAVAVANCRKKGNSGNLYGDVAVIQYNRVNGATCFYQADLVAPVDGNFSSPTSGTSLVNHSERPNSSASPWLSTLATKNIQCAGCHDNGPILRSPYLTQLTFMPGRSDNTYNRTSPVSFIGDDFQDWVLHSVQISGNTCNGCHRMGVSRINSLGTSREFGPRATAMTEPAKNPHSTTSPIWMTPGQITYSAASETSAIAIKTCATAWAANQALPAGCSVSQFSSTFRGLTPALTTTFL